MAKVKVTCEINEYSDSIKTRVLVHNHWNSNEFVELEIKGERYTLSAIELKTAIENCTNTGFK